MSALVTSGAVEVRRSVAELVQAIDEFPYIGNGPARGSRHVSETDDRQLPYLGGVTRDLAVGPSRTGSVLLSAESDHRRAWLGRVRVPVHVRVPDFNESRTS